MCVYIYIYIYFAQPFFPLFPSSPLSSPHVLTLFLPICTFLFCHALLLLSARILFYHSACTFPLMFITFSFFLSCFRIETKKKKSGFCLHFFVIFEMCRSKQSRCFFFFFFVLENYSLYFCCLHRENSVLSLLILLILFFFPLWFYRTLFFFFKRVPSFFFLLFGRVGNVDVIFILVYFSELQYIVQRCRFTYAFFSPQNATH